MAAPPTLPAALGALKNGPEPDISTAPYSGPLPRGLNKALIPPTGKEALPTSPENKHRFHKDWSVGVGSNWDHRSRPVPRHLHPDQLALRNRHCPGQLRIGRQLGHRPNGERRRNGGRPHHPSPVAPASYNGCTAPCQTTVAFSGGNSDTYSSPFYDYSSDTLYVGDDNGRLHQFTGVFLGTPAESTTGGWPLVVSSPTTGGALGSPVYDATTGLVFVGDYLLNYASTCEPSATNSAGSCGYLYSILASTTAVNKSAQLDYQYGIVDSPIVDSTTAQVYAFAGADKTTACSSGPCAGVFNVPEAFSSGAAGNEVQVGAGYEFLLSGSFDNGYFNSGTGNLYVVGGTGPQNNTLYGIAITPSTFGPATTGPAVAGNYTEGYYAGGLQVTEFYTGTNDYIFAGALTANAANDPLVGLGSGFDVTNPPISQATAPTGTILAQGGPSGIVVDNSLASAQNIYYSTILNSTCTTNGSGGCAVQTIQSAP